MVKHLGVASFSNQLSREMRWRTLNCLSTFVAVYVLIGAFVFKFLESKEHEKYQRILGKQKSDFLEKYPCVDSEALEILLRGNPTRRDESQWDMSNSVFFTVTLLTTIGYGNLAPKSDAGRIFCVIYGIFGIPLVLAVLAGLGNKAKAVSIHLTQRIPTSSTQILLLSGLMCFLLVPAVVFSYVEGWTLAEGFYYAFVTLATVGFGDLIAGVQDAEMYPVWYRPWRLLWLLLGLTWLSIVVNLNKDMVKSVVNRQQLQRPLLALYSKHASQEDSSERIHSFPLGSTVNEFAPIESYTTLTKSFTPQETSWHESLRTRAFEELNN